MHKKLVLFSFLSIISFDALGGQLRNGQEIFQEPAKGSLTQIFAGLTEAKLAQAMWPGMTQHEKLVKEAQKELTLTRTMPTSDLEKNVRIDATAKAIAEVENNRVLPKPLVNQVVKADVATPTLLEKLEFFTSNNVVSVEEKARLVAAAEEKVAERTRQALAAAQAEGYIVKGLRIARYGASILIGLDAGARVYVWNMYDSNPGFSPVVGYTAAQINALFGN